MNSVVEPYSKILWQDTYEAPFSNWGIAGPTISWSWYDKDWTRHVGSVNTIFFDGHGETVADAAFGIGNGGTIRERLSFYALDLTHQKIYGP